MSDRFRLLLALCILLAMTGCAASRPSPQTVTMVIESSPNSLDLRIGVDVQSEHIGSLIFAFTCAPVCIFTMANR
jgi:peptide/nickel transport system substrate-binding protein